MTSRFATLALLVLILAGPARSDEPSRDDGVRGPEVREISAQGARALRRGLAWLASHQEANGSWRSNVGFKRNNDYVVEDENVGHPGITALAGMAFLAGGNVPGRGKYGRNVEKAVEYILKCVDSDGMITNNGTRMYSHAFGTLFLAEIYGMSRDSRVKAKLERAAQFTWKCQNENGGWRYVAFDRDSDMSITVCQVMALRAARNIGIRVPKESIARAVNYVLMSANTAPDDNCGSFRYQYRPGVMAETRSTFPLTAAGLATLFMAGLYKDEDILAHIRDNETLRGRFLRQDPPPRIEPILDYLRLRYGTTPKRHYFFFYGNYYAVQAMFIAGGARWEEYFRWVQDDLVQMQEDDGSWPHVGVGSAFTTAVATLILQVPYRYLPIFSR